ncbi:MAG: hypothetical protein H0T79_08205 [Deltaproteobacteria bacterium]|nr:hypothetical protein [Deltaproteobacteria bacterium]
MAVRSKKPALVAIEAPPKPAAIPKDDRARFPANEYVFVAGRRTFMLAFAASKTSLGWLDAGALQTLDIPRYQGIGIHPDGTRALFAANRTVCEVVLATGVVTKLIDLGGGWDACGCGYGPGETAVVATGDRVVLLRREGDTLVELQQLPVHGSGLSVYRDGTLAVCTTYKHQVIAFTITDTALTQRAVFRCKTATSYAVDDRIFVTDYTKTFELVNV